MNTASVIDGAAVIQSAIDAFGRITVLVNNAGVLRDKGCVRSRLGLGRFARMVDSLRGG